MQRKTFKNIFATQLDIQEKHFGKKKSFRMMAAKHCSGHHVADNTLDELKQQFKIVLKSQSITLQDHRCNVVSHNTSLSLHSAYISAFPVNIFL